MIRSERFEGTQPRHDGEFTAASFARAARRAWPVLLVIGGITGGAFFLWADEVPDERRWTVEVSITGANGTTLPQLRSDAFEETVRLHVPDANVEVSAPPAWMGRTSVLRVNIVVVTAEAEPSAVMAGMREALDLVATENGEETAQQNYQILDKPQLSTFRGTDFRSLATIWAFGTFLLFAAVVIVFEAFRRTP